jgi:hypothetical protein
VLPLKTNFFTIFPIDHRVIYSDGYDDMRTLLVLVPPVPWTRSCSSQPGLHRLNNTEVAQSPAVLWEKACACIPHTTVCPHAQFGPEFKSNSNTVSWEIKSDYLFYLCFSLTIKNTNWASQEVSQCNNWL